MSNKPANNLRQSIIDKSAQVVNTVNTGYLGQCKVVEDKNTGRFLLLKEQVYNGEDEFNTALKNAQVLKTLNEDGLLYLVDYSAEKVNNFCSSFLNLKLYFLPHLQELRTLFEEREKSNGRFSEKDMTYMLYHLTQGLSSLHRAGFIHKQITPESVDTTNLVGRNPKLMFFEDGNSSNINQATYNNIFKSKDMYAAPEIYERATQLVKPNNTIAFNEQKLDAFSLGMTLLHAGCAHSVQDCYDKKNYKFNVDNLIKHLDQFKTYYFMNPMVTEAVEKLLEIDPLARISAVDLESELPKLEEIDQYFDVSNDNMQGDYHEKYPISAEDKRAAEQARAYLISKNKLKSGENEQPQGQGQGVQQQPQVIPQSTESQFIPTTEKRVVGNSGLGYQTGHNGQGLKPEVSSTALVTNGSPQTNFIRNAGAPYESQLVQSNIIKPEQNESNLGGATGPSNSNWKSGINTQTGSSHQTPLAQQNNYGAPRTNFIQGNQGESQPSNQSQPQSNYLSSNPLISFKYPGSPANNPGVTGSRAPANQELESISPSINHIAQVQKPGGVIGLGSTQNPLHSTQPIISLAQNPATQEASSKIAINSQPAGPVMANHNIFSRPAPRYQQPTYTSYKPSTTTTTLPRSASQPTRIGIDGITTSIQGQPTPTRTYVTSGTPSYQPQTSIYANRQVSYSQSNLSRPYESGIVSGSRIIECQPRQYVSPMIVTRPSITNVGTPNRIRSSSYNIVRNGVVVGQDDPNQEIRASRIVVSRDKVDFHVEETQGTRQYVSATPVTYQAPVVTSRAPVVTSRAPYAYTTGTSQRVSQYSSGGVITHGYPHSVIGVQPYSSTSRVYASGTPVRYGGYTTTAGAPRVVSNVPTSGITYSSGGANYVSSTPRRYVSGSSQAYTTPKPVQRYEQVLQGSYINLYRGYGPADTPSRQNDMVESKYVSQPQKIVEHVESARQHDRDQNEHREDSDIKPRELEDGEGEANNTQNQEDTTEQVEPAWNE